MIASSSTGRQAGPARGRVVLSVPWSWAFTPPRDEDVLLVRRPSDWQVSRRRAAARSVGAIGALVRRVRAGDHVVLCTMGPTAGVFAALVRLRRPASISVFDFLSSPRGASPSLTALLRRHVDQFLVIRRGDVGMLGRRFGIPENRCCFVPWALPTGPDPELKVTDGDYLYAAGWAHRDWETLLRALRLHPVRAVLAPGRELGVALPDGCTVIDMPSPDEGRRLAAGARMVAVLLEDVDHAAGPLVLLDALAMGKPVIATDANGNRDYVQDGQTALVVPCRDAEALVDAIVKLWPDPALRHRLGMAARASVLEHNSASDMWRALLGAVRERHA